MMEHRYGGFWRRAVAFYIDKLILYIIYFILVIMELQLFPSSPYADRPDVPAGILGQLTFPFMMGHFAVYLGIGMAYFTHFHGSIGQTPGKMLLKLKVVRITGKNMTYGIAWVRWVGYILSRIPLCLGFIWIAFDCRKQGWHDKLAGTVVVITDVDGQGAYLGNPSCDPAGESHVEHVTD